MPERSGYGRSKLNATKHGVLSEHLLLPWEDRDELDALHEALVAEHTPKGPTEHYLVEEIAGIMWRKRRLVLAETAVYRAGLRRAVSYGPSYDSVSSRALAHLNERDVSADVSKAIRATPATPQMTAPKSKRLKLGSGEHWRSSGGASPARTRRRWGHCPLAPTIGGRRPYASRPSRGNAVT